MNLRLTAVAIAMISVAFNGTSGVAAAAQRTLVEKAQPRATIVVQKDEPKSQRAAELIQACVEKMSKAKLPIVADGEAVPEGHVALLVGHTARAKALGVAIPSGYDASVHDDVFEEEGYVLKTIGNEIVVAGNNDGPYKGTIYAAAALLERLGCRWYFPGEWGEVIPESDTVVIAEDLDITSRPDFPLRHISLGGWIPSTPEERKQYAEWSDKIGFSESRLYPVVGDGFLAYLVSPKEYFAEHPEYFAMNESGQREVGAKNYENTTMLCLSNPQVFAESVKNVKEALAGTKDKKSPVMRIVADNGVGISPPDGVPYCYCPECKKNSQNFQYPTYAHRTMQSEEVFDFAARLAREIPDKYVSTMAYALREMPPQGVEIPRNMMVNYAPISNDVLHPMDSKYWRQVEFVEMLKQWRELTPHVTIYDYNPGFLTGFFVPEREVGNAAANYAMYKKLDIKGFGNEGRKAFMQTWISYYVHAKLMWDSSADVEAIKRDFYDTFFGAEAGKHVQAWWDGCEQALVEDDIQAHEDFLINHIYNTSLMQRIRPHVEAARAAKATAKQKERIEAFALIADHLDAFAAMGAAEAEMDWATAAAAARKMVDCKRKLHQTYSFFIEVDEKRARPYFAEGRALKFDEHKARTDGTAGKLVAPLPRTSAFKRDPYNEGIIHRWYLPAVDHSNWDQRDTFFLWDQQEPMLDEAGHDYDGYGWYRMTVDVPAEFKDKPVTLTVGGVVNEGWVWVNGKYAGHKEHHLWWNHNHQADLDVSKLVEAGKPNTIAIRVWNNAEPGGLYRRGYLWSPLAAPKAEAAAK